MLLSFSMKYDITKLLLKVALYITLLTLLSYFLQYLCFKQYFLAYIFQKTTIVI